MDQKVSIVVPVYRVEKYLDRCVKSILAQTFSDFELILVDDGSPDRCPQMCDTWAERDERICVIHKKNGGLAEARNYGVRIAKGKYIAFVDSDDWVEANILETLLIAMESGSYDMVQCNFRRVFQNGSELLYCFPPAVYDRDAIQNVLMPDMLNDRLKQISSSRCNKLYKTEILRKAIPLCDATIAMGEDYLLNFAFLGFARTICCLETRPLYHYRENDQSMCARYKSRDKYEKIRYYENMDRLAHFFQCSEIPSFAQKIQKRWQYYIYECAISNWSRSDKKKEIREIIGMLDRKLWRSSIKYYDILAERVCMWMSYFGMIDLMLLLVDMMKKIKGIN